MNDITIIQQQNVADIARQAPAAFNANRDSHDRCLAAGQTLLDTIESLGGLNEELDQQVAKYIDRVKKTLNKMNEQRSPVTKLFDEFRTVFTTLENDINPAKAASIPGRLQAARNEYARQKHQQAEARRREAERTLQAEAARKTYRNELEEAYRQSFFRMLNSAFNDIQLLFNNVTLENYTATHQHLQRISTILTEDDLQGVYSTAVRYSSFLKIEEAQAIRQEVMAALTPQFKDQYSFEISTNLAHIIDMMPSKRNELQAISLADEQQAEALKQQMAAREQAEAMRREAERAQEEAKRKELQAMQAQQAAAGDLFVQAQATVYTPEAKVKKRLEILDPRGFLEIINLWWVNEGCDLTINDLTKKFKTQVTFCEKLANDKKNPITINSPYLAYVDEVKAK